MKGQKMLDLLSECRAIPKGTAYPQIVLTEDGHEAMKIRYKKDGITYGVAVRFSEWDADSTEELRRAVRELFNAVGVPVEYSVGRMSWGNFQKVCVCTSDYLNV